ncbi:MAG: VWA domain-containing protein [Chitinispirillales bacterium]|jgi:Ca-activated chloride channel family protein|nr:VWA domain-containing protein [Chitinispirillales bacterium]
MRFGNPEFFSLLLLLPLLAVFFLIAYRRKLAALALFASDSLIKKLSASAGPSRYILKSTFFCLFFLFIVFALARPKFGVKMEMVERKGVDIMIALDISHSMLAQDLAPNRIERAKLEIRKFINLLKGDRIGLIIFAGESFVQCPLTLDHAAAQLMLQSVSTDWVQTQGTALGDVIKQAAKALDGGTSRKRKVLIILSDGEDHEGNVTDAAKQAAKEGIIIYTIGIGSETGVPIPMNRGTNNVVYKKDKAGNLVMTRLNPVTLEKIALETNGKYFHAGTNLDLTRIYNEISRMEKTEFGMTKAVVHEEQYQIFLLIALIFILIEFFISERARKKEVWKGRFE